MKTKAFFSEIYNGQKVKTLVYQVSGLEIEYMKCVNIHNVTDVSTIIFLMILNSKARNQPVSHYTKH